MTILRATAILLSQAIMATAWAADSADATRKREETCVAQITERTAALVARDWVQLERLAERYLKICKDIFGAEDYSTAYEHVSVANIQIDNAKKALSASDTCISTFYSNSGCHIQRVEALIRLKRLPDAKSALEKAERLIKHAMELGQRDLKGARTASEKELYEARLSNFTAQQSHASALRDRYFVD